MSITKYFSGNCPTLNKQYTVGIDYIDASNLSSGRQYIKGLANCEHAANGSCPNVNECPIINDAPQKI